MLYKVTGVWGSHEGSMMLWVLMLTLFGGLVAALGPVAAGQPAGAHIGDPGAARLRHPGLHHRHLEPVRPADPGPLDGRDLNPLLQDPGLAFHPPFLYFGYVGFSITYSFAIAALIEGRVGAAMGALGAALGVDRLVRADDRHRDGQLVGLLRARLGRLVVLGPGRERLLHAVAARHRAAALGGRRRKARDPAALDRAAGDPDLLA